jgi:hypothetical protein
MLSGDAPRPARGRCTPSFMDVISSSLPSSPSGQTDVLRRWFSSVRSAAGSSQQPPGPANARARQSRSRNTDGERSAGVGLVGAVRAHLSTEDTAGCVGVMDQLDQHPVDRGQRRHRTRTVGAAELELQPHRFSLLSSPLLALALLPAPWLPLLRPGPRSQSIPVEELAALSFGSRLQTTLAAADKCWKASSEVSTIPSASRQVADVRSPVQPRPGHLAAHSFRPPSTRGRRRLPQPSGTGSKEGS